ncbi:hypothetical protein MBLNU457_7530t2 [Dothideomycetes sp. NU457]
MPELAHFQMNGQLPLNPLSLVSTSLTTSYNRPSPYPTELSSTPTDQDPSETDHVVVQIKPSSSSKPCHVTKPSSSGFFSRLVDYFGLSSTSESSRAKQGEQYKDQAQPLADEIDSLPEMMSSAEYWTSGSSDPTSWSIEEQEARSIPQYVLDYAPYVHLFSGEEFWPCDIAEHLTHITPKLNYTPIYKMRKDRTLDNLEELNRVGGRSVYLTSNDNVEERPDWLGGSSNIPEDVGTVMTNGTERPVGRSSAPAVLVVVPKEDGVVDAFWFYFYSYNLGNKVLNIRFGNHVGDWEHTLVRFRNGVPIQVSLSEHSWGEAYAYSAIEKIGQRPLTFSATGSHAMYATPGLHPYVLPLGVLHDQTDRGPLWDPALNMHSYTYNLHNGALLASNHTPQAPTNWFYYGGRWGDKMYPTSDSRQYSFAGQYHYVSGPLGARFKNLGRANVCQGGAKCEIRYWLPPSGMVKHISPEQLQETVDTDVDMESLADGRV